MKNPFESGKVRITQTYNPDHLALDLVSEGSWNIVALEDARVELSTMITDKNNLTWTYGNFIKYKLADGTYILCAHMSERKVKSGDVIKKGQVIGVMGSTGYSTGAHLHIEHRAEDSATRLPVYEYLGVKNEIGYCVPIEEKPKEKAPAPSKGIAVGDNVRIVGGATYTNGVKVPAQYIGKTYTVSKKMDGQSLIEELYSWVKDSYLVKVGGNTEKGDGENKKSIGVGSKVKIKSGAVYTNGVKVPPSIVGVAYTVTQIDAKKALLKEINSWVERKYLVMA